jgi:hypothetical protein
MLSSRRRGGVGPDERDHRVGTLGSGDGEQLGHAVDALQRLGAPGLGGDIRADHQVSDGPGGEDRAGSCRGHDPRRHVDGHAAHVAVAQLDSPMWSPARSSTRCRELVPNGGGAMDPSPGTVEDSEDAVPEITLCDESARSVGQSEQWMPTGQRLKPLALMCTGATALRLSERLRRR